VSVASKTPKARRVYYGSQKRLRVVGRDLKLGVRQQSPYENIYYCCTQRTGSQWFRAVFNDGAFYRYTGLLIQPYRHIGLRYASFDEPFPPRTLATHLYISYPTYLSIPKPSSYKTFFVMRDPRDAIVSWYFAARYSHALVAVIPAMRRDLEQLDEAQGLLYIIDKLGEFGSYEAQRSWMNPRVEDSGIRVFRYEDLAADNRSFLTDLFDYLDIGMPPREVSALCERRGFSKRAGGRSQGQEDIFSHRRKGVSGDWKLHFSQVTLDHFRKVTGDLLEVLGYPNEPL